MYNSSSTPDSRETKALKRFFQLAGPAFLDLPRDKWPALLGMSPLSYSQLLEDLVVFGGIQLPSEAYAAVNALEVIYRTLRLEIADCPGKRYADLLAGLPAGDTIISEAARGLPVFIFNMASPVSLVGFLEKDSPLASGRPYSTDRLVALSGFLSLVEWHVIRREDFLCSVALGENRDG